MVLLTKANLVDRTPERWASFLGGPTSQSICYDYDEEQEVTRVLTAQP